MTRAIRPIWSVVLSAAPPVFFFFFVYFVWKRAGYKFAPSIPARPAPTRFSFSHVSHVSLCLMCVCLPSYSSFVASLIAVSRWVYIFLFCLNFDIIHEMAVIGHRSRAYRLSVAFSPIQWGYTIRPLIINPWKWFFGMLHMVVFFEMDKEFDGEGDAGFLLRFRMSFNCCFFFLLNGNRSITWVSIADDFDRLRNTRIYDF